jgi:hypothetical protein
MAKTKTRSSSAVARRLTPSSNVPEKEELKMQEAAHEPELQVQSADAVVAATTPPIKGGHGDINIVARMRKAKMIERLRAQDKVPIVVSPMYRPYVGKVMPIQINGITVYVAANGEPHLVPKPFAEVWYERQSHIDTVVLKQQGMANISSNVENVPGELSLF